MRFFILFFIILNLFAENEVIKLFKNKEYITLCKQRWKYLNKYRFKNEKLLSLIAYSCLKTNNLIYALDLAKNLTMTKEGRNNALYIESLFLIKNLIISYLKGDNLPLESINIPQLKDNLLWKIFEYIKTNKPQVINYSIIFKINNLKYKIYPYDHSTNLVIEIYKNDKLEKKVKMW